MSEPLKTRLLTKDEIAPDSNLLNLQIIDGEDKLGSSLSVQKIFEYTRGHDGYISTTGTTETILALEGFRIFLYYKSEVLETTDIKLLPISMVLDTDYSSPINYAKPDLSYREYSYPLEVLSLGDNKFLLHFGSPTFKFTHVNITNSVSNVHALFEISIFDKQSAFIDLYFDESV